MQKIVLTCGKMEEFVRRDSEILQEEYDVEELIFSKMSRSQFITTMKKKMKEADLMFGWFAGWHSALGVKYAKRAKKKSIVTAGGYDVVSMPEINYGLWRSIKGKIPSGYAIRNADVVISVSKTNQNEMLEKALPKKNRLIYSGVDTKSFYPGDKKENIAITVGTVKNSNLKRKGLETFVKAAKYVPSIPFYVIGRTDSDDALSYLTSIATPNVKFTGHVSNKELGEWYQKAKVYVQSSAHEAFGLSMAEAMYCKCVPVVSDRGALPEIVGETGFVVPYDDPKKTGEFVKKVIDENISGEDAHKRVKENFTLDIHRKRLLSVVEEVLNDSSC